jgi:hypothetical protein
LTSLKVVEVIPPLFAAGRERIAPDAAFDAFVEGVRRTARHSDLTPLASAKGPGLIRFDPCTRRSCCVAGSISTARRGLNCLSPLVRVGPLCRCPPALHY